MTIESKIAISTQNSKGYFGFLLSDGMDITSQLYLWAIKSGDLEKSDHHGDAWESRGDWRIWSYDSRH